MNVEYLYLIYDYTKQIYVNRIDIDDYKFFCFSLH